MSTQQFFFTSSELSQSHTCKNDCKRICFTLFMQHLMWPLSLPWSFPDRGYSNGHLFLLVNDTDWKKPETRTLIRETAAVLLHPLDFHFWLTLWNSVAHIFCLECTMCTHIYSLNECAHWFWMCVKSALIGTCSLRFPLPLPQCFPVKQ